MRRARRHVHPLDALERRLAEDLRRPALDDFVLAEHAGRAARRRGLPAHVAVAAAPRLRADVERVGEEVDQFVLGLIEIRPARHEDRAVGDLVHERVVVNDLERGGLVQPRPARARGGGRIVDRRHILTAELVDALVVAAGRPQHRPIRQRRQRRVPAPLQAAPLKIGKRVGLRPRRRRTRVLGCRQVRRVEERGVGVPLQVLVSRFATDIGVLLGWCAVRVTAAADVAVGVDAGPVLVAAGLTRSDAAALKQHAAVRQVRVAAAEEDALHRQLAVYEQGVRCGIKRAELGALNGQHAPVFQQDQMHGLELAVAVLVRLPLHVRLPAPHVLGRFLSQAGGGRERPHRPAPIAARLSLQRVDMIVPPSVSPRLVFPGAHPEWRRDVCFLTRSDGCGRASADARKPDSAYAARTHARPAVATAVRTESAIAMTTINA
ncbi:MAG: hypothetical protein CHACPFDD_03899 [Phycisphaerae bacterium]|nr:hypothetical protein [Phycisphaerae bacterium]